MRKFVAMVLVLLMVAVAAPAADASKGRHHRLPPTIDLPDGFFPEGIASGRGSTFYVGSLSDGSIYKGDYRTGEGQVFTEPVGPFATVGLTVDRQGRVWAAGGTSGQGRVYNGRTGELLATYNFTGPLESFINDVIVTRDGAWFTDSGTRNSPDPANFQFAGEPRVFHVPFDRGRRLPAGDKFEELSVDMPDIAFPNLNGIETTPDRRALVIAHNVEGTLYRVNYKSGAAAQIEIDESFAGPDGLLRLGRYLYVVEPGANQVSEVRLNRRGTEGKLKRALTVPDGETPTTAAYYRGGVYVVDARFQSNVGPYKVTRLSLW